MAHGGRPRYRQEESETGVQGGQQGVYSIFRRCLLRRDRISRSECFLCGKQASQGTSSLSASPCWSRQVVWRAKRDVEYPPENQADTHNAKRQRQHAGAETAVRPFAFTVGTSASAGLLGAPVGPPPASSAAFGETLQEAFDAAVAVQTRNLKRSLSDDERLVVKSAEVPSRTRARSLFTVPLPFALTPWQVLLWSYVAKMDELSTAILRETVEPINSVPGSDSSTELGERKISATSRSGSSGNEEGGRSGGGSKRSGRWVRKLKPLGDSDSESSEADSEYNEPSPKSLEKETSTHLTRRGRRVRKASEFLDPSAPPSKEANSSDSAQGGDDVPDPPKVIISGDGVKGEPLSWRDGLVCGGYFDLVPRHLAQGLHVECGRVATRVEWEGSGASSCRVTTESSHPRLRRTFSKDDVPGGADGEQGDDDADCRVDECDFIVVALPLGVMKGRHAASSVKWIPDLPPRKIEAFKHIGFGAENKVILRFTECFWEADKPYIQITDDRFRILNGLCFGKGNTLVVHCSPPFGNGYDGLSDDQDVVAEVMRTLKGMYSSNSRGVVPSSASAVPMATPDTSVPDWPIFFHVTRWHEDPFSMGAYSFWPKGMELQHVLDSARPEPEMHVTSREACEGDHNRHGPLAPPRLFFCGEHATIHDAQCVHGACNSGERAGRQVACAALGRLEALHACIEGEEKFWYSLPTDFPDEDEGDEICCGPNASGTFELPASNLRDVPSGKSLLMDPSFSPFPTEEAVKWHRSERWFFSCPCGTEGQNYDDGSPMIQCDGCASWQHESCVIKLKLFVADSMLSSSGAHKCHQCEPSLFQNTSISLQPPEQEPPKLVGGNQDGLTGLLGVKGFEWLAGCNSEDDEHYDNEDVEASNPISCEGITTNVNDDSGDSDTDTADASELSAVSQAEWRSLAERINEARRAISNAGQKTLANVLEVTAILASQARVGGEVV